MANATTTSGELSHCRETRLRHPAKLSPLTGSQFSGSASARLTGAQSFESRLATPHTKLLSTHRRALIHPTRPSQFHPISSLSWATIDSTRATADTLDRLRSVRLLARSYD